MTWFVDTSVLLVAAGGDSPDRAACQAFLQRAREQGRELHASVEAVQEFVHHRMRREGRAPALAKARALADACVLHTFDDEVLRAALRLIEGSDLRGRDAVHAATALRAGFAEIVSLDPDFDRAPGLVRVQP